jgi:hypothetical protein
MSSCWILLGTPLPLPQKNEKKKKKIHIWIDVMQIALCNPNHQVMVTLALAGIPELIGESWYFVRVHDAVQVCTSLLQSEAYDSGSNNPENLRRGGVERWGKYDRDQHSSHPSSTRSAWRREPVQSDSERTSLLNATDSV